MSTGFSGEGNPSFPDSCLLDISSWNLILSFYPLPSYPSLSFVTSSFQHLHPRPSLPPLFSPLCAFSSLFLFRSLLFLHLFLFPSYLALPTSFSSPHDFSFLFSLFPYHFLPPLFLFSPSSPILFLLSSSYSLPLLSLSLLPPRLPPLLTLFFLSLFLRLLLLILLSLSLPSLLFPSRPFPLPLVLSSLPFSPPSRLRLTSLPELLTPSRLNSFPHPQFSISGTRFRGSSDRSVSDVRRLFGHRRRDFLRFQRRRHRLLLHAR